MKVLFAGKDIPVLGEYEVVVAGAGASGICAAISSSREGKRTALIERYGIVGGNLTSGYIGPIMGGTSHGTISEEIHRRLKVEPRKVHNFEQAKIELALLLQEAGVDLFLQCSLADVLMEEEKEITGLVLATQMGLSAILGKCFIDSTGDGTLAFLAGASYEYGRSDKLVQPVSLMFILGGVSSDAIYCEGVNPDVHVPSGNFIRVCEEACEKGILPPKVNTIRIFHTGSPNERMINATQKNYVDTLSSKSLSDAEAKVRKQIQTIHTFLQTVAPGYENSFIQGSSSTMGIRESRRINGEYILQDDDIETGRTFSDVVVHRANFLIDIHNPDGGGQAEGVTKSAQAYDIPYRCLVPKDVKNLLIAGRAISGTHRAHASYRVMNICMPMGQAAGIAAALCVESGVSPLDLDVSVLQDRLIALGVDLFSDDQIEYPFNPSNREV
ncbi:MAG: FAD-dependent oxidoreductase [Sphaerochaeta sp.]|nr:FAD-dependent oxidoreductase [Sphaerochaeta sp.]